MQAGRSGPGQEASANVPVTEVGLSVMMARQAVLTGPTFPRVLGTWLESHSRVETLPPYVMPAESEGIPIPARQTPQLSIVTSGLEPRYWLHSEDGTEVIQVQSDYIGLNWRRGDGNKPYIGFEEIKDRFLNLLQTASAGLREIDGLLEVSRAELTYVNVISPNRLWSRLSDMNRVMSVDFPEVGDCEYFTFGYAKNISYDDRLRGRLHVGVQPSYDWVKDEPRIGLSLVARSLELSDRTIEGAVDFLDRSHREAGKAFRKMLSPGAREMWGFADGDD